MAEKGPTAESLRLFALRLPGAEEGVACEGTALEARTIQVRGKAFLFLRRTEARLKLGASFEEAAAWSAKDPSHCNAGAHGWVLAKLEGCKIPARVLEGWIVESHALHGGGKAAREPAKPEATSSSRSSKSARSSSSKRGKGKPQAER